MGIEPATVSYRRRRARPGRRALGQVQVVFGIILCSRALIKQDRLRALVVTSVTRLPSPPDVPSELMPDY